ncbi:MAG: hypothetical protein EOP06_18120 [Proteobacteria bacterium]|nr:MAG: hypothetical protein EOP06_18120 [Pseudomonadota bacterium]
MDLEALSPPETVTPAQLFRISNLKKFREVVVNLSIVPAFSGYANVLFESPIFSNDRDVFELGAQDYHNYSYISKLLKYSARGLLNSIENQLANEQTESLAIKLPESKHLRSVVNDLDAIEKAISQVVFDPEVDGRVDVVTWEPGSLWIEIFLGSAAATTIIGSIAWAAAVISKKRQEAFLVEQYVEGLKTKNDMLKDLRLANRSMLDLQVESEAKAILQEKRQSPERLARIQFSIKEFASLIERGAEVHPALSAPESVKNLFPGVINPIAIESRIPRIENSVVEGDSPPQSGAAD